MSDPDNTQSLLPDEIPSMTVWPSIAAFGLGRWVGRMCDVRLGFGQFFTLGKLLALATIPLTLVLFFWRLAPVVARRYLLTNRRVIVCEGLSGTPGKALDLAEFDTIRVEVLPGQAFLRAGDLVFLADENEIFRLPGVQHPEGFRRACLRAAAAQRTVGEVLRQQSPSGDSSSTAGSAV